MQVGQDQENTETERLGVSGILSWMSVYAGFALIILFIWPFFAIRNFWSLMRSRSFFGLGIFLIVLDQASKWGMWNYLGHPGGRVVLIPGYFDLTLVTNQGAAFGLFPGQTMVFIGMALLTIGIIVAYLSMIGEEEWMVRLALVCIMAGAIGNLIDRIFLGYVIDFLDVHYGNAHWPVFNIADVVIDLGVGLILLDVVRDFFRSRDRVPQAS